MKAYNLKSDAGNPVVNQIVTEMNDVYTLFSYGSMIVQINFNTMELFIGNDYDYSRTTGKYRNKFLHDKGLYEISNLESLREAIEKGFAMINNTKFNVTKVNY